MVLFILSASSAYADVTGHLTVAWTKVFMTFYTVGVCIEDTSIFGSFGDILIEYSKDEHTGSPPSPVQDKFNLSSGNRWCADLDASGIWDSASPADTLANAKISVRDNNKSLLFQDDSWAANTAVNVADSNHIFHGSGVDCKDNDGDGFDGFDAHSCPVGNDCDDATNTVHPGASDTVCNGIDNDCDSQIDEDYVVAPTSCGVGACAAAGQLQCVNGNEVDTCTPGTPTEEVCGDGIDNDCVNGDESCPAPPSDDSGNNGDGGNSGGGGSGGSGGGGGGGLYHCTNEWQCDEWNYCIDGQQTRTCNFVELNPSKLLTKFCDKESSPPEEKRECTVEEKQIKKIVETCFDGVKNQNEENMDCGGVCKPCKPIKKTKSETDNPSLKSITGAAISKVEKPNLAIGLSIILAIVGIGVYLYEAYNKKDTDL